MKDTVDVYAHILYMWYSDWYTYIYIDTSTLSWSFGFAVGHIDFQSGANIETYANSSYAATKSYNIIWDNASK